MKKKICISLLTVFLLFSLPSQSVIEAVTSFLFKGYIYLNNEKVDFKQDIYNMNGSVYVPLRELTEILDGYVSYDSKDQSVYIEQAKVFSSKSVLNEFDEKSMKLQVFSGKLEYEFGESLEIWSRLSNVTPNTIDIYHSDPLIQYSIIDEDGIEGKLIGNYALYTTSFLPNDEFTSVINRAVNLIYNFNKSQNNDLKEFINKSVQPLTLPKGNYEIKVEAQYAIKAEENTIHNNEKLEVSIPIVIK